MRIHSKIIEIVHAILVYICMDRDWIKSLFINVEYEKVVEEFIQFAQCNGRKLNVTEVREHLICDGFIISYIIQISYDELIDFLTVSRTKYVIDSTMEERVE